MVPTRTLYAVVFSLAYASVLASLPVDAFIDRENYLSYAGRSDIILERSRALGWLVMLFNEPAWLYLNILIGTYLPAEGTLRVIIFGSALALSMTTFALCRRNVIWASVFLLVPMVLKNNVIHLRQGVGIAVFITGYHLRHRAVGKGLMAVSGFVHASFFIIGFIGTVIWCMDIARLSARGKVVIATLSFVALGTVVIVIAGFLGARQAEVYEDFDLSGSGFGFVFWLLLMAVFLSSGRAFLARHTFPIAIVGFYIATYFTVPFTARVLESGMVLILVASLDLTGWRKPTFLAMIVTLSLAFYASRIGEPWLGWGAPF
ncbi:hypothetical protein [Jannaschia sp. LMIT008]|uniref:hypothetical protein n=1 Tax=Jannaschia maritima TaxID=3032585 RepID=UPI00281238E2|nr:hypothetical protein [Jannaschia sp. LMIT008]